MHKKSKITPYIRREITKKYQEMQHSYFQTNTTPWGSQKILLEELSVFYRVHRNTIEKIVFRGKQGDFTIHKSTRKDYRCIKRGLQKQPCREEKILKVKTKKEGIRRYEKKYAGELGHIDVHKAKNIRGQNPKKKKYVAALLDDAMRLTYSRLLPNKKAKTLAIFLRDAVLWFQRR